MVHTPALPIIIFVLVIHDFTHPQAPKPTYDLLINSMIYELMMMIMELEKLPSPKKY